MHIFNACEFVVFLLLLLWKLTLNFFPACISFSY